MVIFFVLVVSSHGTITNCDGSQRSTEEFTCYTCRPTTYGGPTQSSTTSESACSSSFYILITSSIVSHYIYTYGSAVACCQQGSRRADIRFFCSTNTVNSLVSVLERNLKMKFTSIPYFVLAWKQVIMETCAL